MRKLKKLFPITARDFLICGAILLGAFGICFALRIFDNGDIFVSMIFLLAVLLISRFTHGYFYGIFASFVGIIFTNFYFTYPYFEFNMSISGYPLTFASMLIAAIITSTTTTQIKEQESLKLAADREKMRSNLLRAISHDLRTPLTSISGASSVLMENEGSFSDKERYELYKEINEDAQWLIRMVENLLSVTRLKKDVGKITKTPEAAEEIVGYAIGKLKKYYPQAKIEVSVPDDLLFVPMDCVLIEQVLINLIENSIRHGKTTTRIRVNIARAGKNAEISVSDDGDGFTADKLEKIRAGMFVTPSENEDDSTKNMGIGLSVCMSIIKAHGGTIKAENLSPKGAKVSFYLPMETEQSE